MGTFRTSRGNFPIYLNRLASMQGNLFHLSFVDHHKKAHMFLMRRINDKWIFTEPQNLPQWITEMENQLDNLIRKEVLEGQLTLQSL